MRKTLIIFNAFLLVLFTSCANDSEDDLVEVLQDQDANEDSSENAITYNGTIKAIVDRSCTGCHSSPPSNGAPFSLVNYTQVSNRANNILSAISRQAGAAGAMPPSGRLPQTTINQFSEWINNDSPED